MKWILLFPIALAAATREADKYFIEQLVAQSDLKREDVLTCINKTSITVEDNMHFDEIVEDNLQITYFDSVALKMGCFYACIQQKREIMTGARINIDKLKETLRSKLKGRNPDELIADFQIFDICNDQVKSKTNECEVVLQFILCNLNELQRKYRRNNDNE